MASENTTIQLTIENHIATIRLNNPERHNALASSDMEQFREALAAIKKNADVRVLILTGAGNKTFCAGAALDQLSAGDMEAYDFPTLTDALAQLSIPKICAFNGSVYGGGVELGLCCDFRIGIPGMRMFVPPARIGICYHLSGIKRYLSLLGAANTKRILVASEEFDTEGLQLMGYLTHLCDVEALEATVRELAERIAGYAPMAVQAMQRIIDQHESGELSEEEANHWVKSCWQSEDLQEGLKAMQEKRAPSFKGN